MKELNCTKQSSRNRIRILNGAQLKWIAMISMLIDHTNKGIILSYQIFFNANNQVLNVISDIMVILGRVAFPIFLYLLVEGFVHTRNRWKYLLYLVGFGCLSEVPYDMFESGQFWDMGGQNMFFTLALALLTLILIDMLKTRFEKFWRIPAIVLTLVSAYLAAWLGLDYTYYGILIPVVIYCFRERRLVGCALSYLIVLKELWSILGFALIQLYNGERGRINKWIGYWFYPVHLLIIGLIRMYVMKV